MEESSFEWKRAQSGGRSSADLVIAEYKSIVESAIQDALKGDSHLTLAASTAISGGGKRLRPITCLLSCEAVAGDFANAIPVALSFELAHAASLIQDDIIDESDLRHHELTTHKKYGSVRAILVSDYLLFTIFSELSKYAKTAKSKNRIHEVLQYVASSAKMAASGEFSDMLLTTKGDVTEEEYFEMAGLKTGSLFAGAAASGAVVGGAKRNVVDAFYHYGHYLGMSFQIIDDILDFVGDPKETGKPLFSDLKNHACNIVTVHALSQADRFDRNSLHSLLLRHSYSTSAAKKVLSVMEKLGTIEYASNLVLQYSALARKHLNILPDSPAKKKLEFITYAILTPLEKRQLIGGNSESS